MNDLATLWPSAGCYRYILNGELTDIHESWSIGSPEEHGLRITSTRRAPGVTIDTRADIRAGRIVSCEVTWRAGTGLVVEAQLQLTDSGLQVQRRQDSLDSEQTSLRLPPAAIHLLSPLMRVYTGPVIAGLIEAGGEGVVVLPAIGDADNPDALLRPQLSVRRAQVLQQDTLLALPDGDHVCRLCSYSGDQYGPDARFWLAGNDLLMKYSWQQSPDQCWDIILSP